MSHTTCANKVKNNCNVPFTSESNLFDAQKASSKLVQLLLPISLCTSEYFSAQEKTVFRAFSRVTKNCVVAGAPPLSLRQLGPRVAPSAQPQRVPDLFGSTDQGSPSTLSLPFANLVNDAKHQIWSSSGRGKKRDILGSTCPVQFVLDVIQPCWNRCALAHPERPETGRRLSNFSLIPPNSTQLGREDQGGGRRVGGSDTTITHTIHQPPKTSPSHDNPSPLKTTHCPRT